MKIFTQMVLKCAAVVALILYLSAQLSKSTIAELKDVFLHHLIENEELSEDALKTVLTSYRIEEIETEWNKLNQIEIPVISKSQKRIYLYNTHQSEEYIDGITIFEVTYQFALMLKQAGFEVVFETSDFMKELNEEGLKYNQLYTISRRHLSDALETYGSFDLIIDVHRDSAKRSVSVLEHEGVAYGRLMFVIGNKSCNASNVSSQSHSLTDKMNQRLDGIMREPFIRQSVYNQDMADSMLLLEVGSDQNTSSEVLRTLEILVDVLAREGIS